MTDPVTLYGIANCDTIKKTRNWLQEQSIEFDFHDYRKQGLEPGQLQAMVSALGWEAMLNRRGTTWRALPDSVKDNIDLESAMQVMLDNPAIIKRPILARKGQFHLGFKPDQYQEIFSQT
jgi:arsenate reductase